MFCWFSRGSNLGRRRPNQESSWSLNHSWLLHRSQSELLLCVARTELSFAFDSGVNESNKRIMQTFTSAAVGSRSAWDVNLRFWTIPPCKQTTLNLKFLCFAAFCLIPLKRATWQKPIYRRPLCFAFDLITPATSSPLCFKLSAFHHQLER